MATQKEIGNTYNPMDNIFQLMLGKHADITNSLPGICGEPTLANLQIAQSKKHEKYFKELKLFPGAKLLDIGCGWGPFMQYCKEKGVICTGLTLSTAQYLYLKKSGFDVHLCPWQEFNSDAVYDAVTAIGSPEHFASPGDFDSGRQSTVYRNLFLKVAQLLKKNGTFGGQFMTWNSDTPSTQELNPYGDENSRGYHLGLLEKFYPGSWLPNNFNDFFAEGSDMFECIEVIDGRIQYIWTMKAWGLQFRKLFPLLKWWYVLKLVPKIIFDNDFRLWTKAFWKKSNQLCFEKGWMGHEFFFLQKKM